MKQDVFGLNTQVYAEMRPPLPKEFAFPRLEQKVSLFMEWLKLQEERGIIQLGTFTRIGGSIEDAWTNMFILDSYKRGVIRARSELNKAGYKVPSIEDSGGIESIMGMPMHADRVGYVYTRAFQGLVEITAKMDTQLSQVLAQGLIDGDNPIIIARKLRATITGEGAQDLGITDSLGRFIPAKRRAEMLARTEIIRAHHMAAIQEYKNWRAGGTNVIAEWSTAGGKRTCEICDSLEGRRYSLEEIENMIPMHPMCRCVAVPIEVNERGEEIEY